jgi:[NiFe] hydrogenase assembly HybE family chaperone
MIHSNDPSALIETVFKDIQSQRMAGMSMLNPELRVQAVGFGRREAPHAEWLGVLVTPWSMGLMLLPADANWPVTASHERAFRAYPAGNFAFLPNQEAGLGDYLVCSLFHDMSQFGDHATAVMTAQASLLALQMAPAQPVPNVDATAPNQPSRRKFLSMGS